MCKAKIPPPSSLIFFENYENLILYLFIVIGLMLGKLDGMAKYLVQCLYLLILILLSVCGKLNPPHFPLPIPFSP
jgi:hypothetical protein